MAPYEPKTDSKAFDVAQPAREPSLGSDSASAPTDVTIRLWGPDWSGLPGSLTWKTDSVFGYMIADLVSASHGRLAEESPTAMAAHFDSSGQALVAAKRIQMSILDFVACRPGNGVAILIHQPGGPGANFSLVQETLRLAKPGQILVSEDVSRRLRDVSGIEVLPVSPLTGAAGQWGLAELVWTTPESLAGLQASVVDGAASLRESQQVGATMIVNTPVPSAEREAKPPAAPPVTGPGDFVYKRSSDSALQRTPTAQQPTADLVPRSDNARGLQSNSLTHDSLTQELDELEQRPFLTRTRVIVGLVAVVLVGALCAVLYLPTNENKVRVRAPENHDTGSGTVDSKPATVHPEPVHPQPQPKPPEAQAKAPKVIAPPPTPAKPTAETRAKNRKDNAVQPQAQAPAPPPQVVEEFGGLSQNDVPTLLKLARDDAGAGRYDKARSEFKKILQLQPNNQDAKDGLRRLDLIKGDSQ